MRNTGLLNNVLNDLRFDMTEQQTKQVWLVMITRITSWRGE